MNDLGLAKIWWDLCVRVAAETWKRLSCVSVLNTLPNRVESAHDEQEDARTNFIPSECLT